LNVNGTQLCASDRQHVLAAFVHRFTSEHKPAWASEPWKDGLPYPQQGGIGFRVVDEYDSTCKITPPFAKRPLRLRQLVQLIDTAEGDKHGPIGLGILQISFECSESPSESYSEFMDFSSEFYPDLSTHYWFATQRWVEQNRRRKAAR
jgi:hypothetical protein